MGSKAPTVSDSNSVVCAAPPPLHAAPADGQMFDVGTITKGIEIVDFLSFVCICLRLLVCLLVGALLHTSYFETTLASVTTDSSFLP